MTIEDLIVRICKLKTCDPKVVELSSEEYDEFIDYLLQERSANRPMVPGSGWDLRKGCYVFGGYEIRHEHRIIQNT